MKYWASFRKQLLCSKVKLHLQVPLWSSTLIITVQQGASAAGSYLQLKGEEPWMQAVLQSPPPRHRAKALAVRTKWSKAYIRRGKNSFPIPLLFRSPPPFTQISLFVSDLSHLPMASYAVIQKSFISTMEYREASTTQSSLMYLASLFGHWSSASSL